MKYTIEPVSDTSKGGLTLKMEGKASPKDTPFFQFLKQCGIRSTEKVEIPPKHTYEAFKALAVIGELYYRDKALIVDLYGKSTLEYRVGEGSRVSGNVSYNGKVIPLADVAMVGPGNPHWYIHGTVVRFITTEISWKDLSQLAYHPETITPKHLQEIVDDDEEGSPRVIFEDNAQMIMEVAAKPTPILKLHDRSGAFADLWFVYGTEALVPSHDSTSKVSAKRDFKAEGEWEKDLLETGFQKKVVGRSHYFCPMDKVAKTLSFLLDLGWRLHDIHDREIVKQENQNSLKLEANTSGEVIHINGKVAFGDYEADLKDVYGAFTRRERFVELGKERVGLLDDTTLTGLSGMDVDAVDSDGLVVRRTSFATMQGVFEGADNVMLDAPLQKLKELLNDLPEQVAIVIPDTFMGVLRHYQMQGVAWMHRLAQIGMHGLLADDMGLGKTVQVIAFLATRTVKNPTLIVVPTTLIFNWVKEFEKFLPSLKVLVHQGPLRTKDPNAFHEADVVLSTYATVRIDLPLFRQVKWGHLILDEAQAIKNDQTQTAQAMSTLQSDFRLSMTGTPIENRFSELWSHFRFLIPDLFDELQKFESDAMLDSRRIKRKVQPFILRRKKDEVAADLPEKIEQVVWVEMSETQRALYEQFLSQIKGSVNTKSRMEVLEAILRLRQFCCHPLLLSSKLDPDASMESAKFAALFADLETLFAENQKVLVYSQFTSMLALMIKEARERKWSFCVLDGTTKDREAQVDKFQNDPEIPLFFISLKAGGAGLNLTAADTVLLYDPWWNDAVERQAIDRVHRMGRSSPVLAKRYIVQESVEEKMMKIKHSKNVLAGDILEEGLDSLRLTSEDLEYLLF